jgi:ubiquinone/menaquinone biosynthesis C-methylase UbiE
MGLRSWLFASAYNRLMASTERAGLADTRARLLGAAVGDVLEVGAGTGLNLPYYGSEVRSLTVTEPDRTMLRRLERAVATSGRSAMVLRSPAEDLPFDDATFDTVVCTLVLCGVDDQPRAARELRRVLRPDGRLLLIEHVRSDDETLARHQDRMNPLSRVLVGCECNRPTQQTLRRCGFVLDELDATELPKSPRFVRPMVWGVVKRTADTYAH